MSAVYVVREGAVRGEGRYLAVLRYWGGVVSSVQQGGTRFEDLKAAHAAISEQRDCAWRPVRLVTLSEQLRRAKKRIAELEKAIKTGGALLRLERSTLGVPGGILDADYNQGRADERAAVVAYLHRSRHVFARAYGDCVRGGEHVKGTTP